MSFEVLSDVCMGEGSQILTRFFFWGGLSGRVSSEVSSNVCMGGGSQILIRFFGGCRAGSRRKCCLMCVSVRVPRF